MIGSDKEVKVAPNLVIPKEQAGDRGSGKAEKPELTEAELRAAGRADAERALQRGRVDNPHERFDDRAERCDEGDAYSCGAADALADHIWKPGDKPPTSSILVPNQYIIGKIARR